MSVLNTFLIIPILAACYLIVVYLLLTLVQRSRLKSKS